MNRRNFIKTAAGTTALTSTAGCLGIFKNNNSNNADSTDEPQGESNTPTPTTDTPSGNSDTNNNGNDTTTTETNTPNEDSREEITLTVNNKFEQLNARTNGINPNYSSNEIAVPLIVEHTGDDTITHIRINFHFNDANGDTIDTTHAPDVPDNWEAGKVVGASVEMDLDPREVSEVVVEFEKMF